MSGHAQEADRNRKERRARTSASAKEQQLAQLMMQVHDSGKLVRRERESDEDYFGRVRDKAQQIIHYERAAKRKSARAARKRNR